MKKIKVDTEGMIMMAKAVFIVLATLSIFFLIAMVVTTFCRVTTNMNETHQEYQEITEVQEKIRDYYSKKWYIDVYRCVHDNDINIKDSHIDPEVYNMYLDSTYQLGKFELTIGNNFRAVYYFCEVGDYKNAQQHVRNLVDDEYEGKR